MNLFKIKEYESESSVKDEEENNKKIIYKMYSIIIVSLVIYFAILLLALSYLKEGILLGLIIVSSTAALAYITFYATSIEIKTGYYECNKCQHRYKPNSIIKVMISPHINYARLLKCPECHSWSWSKKVMSK